MAKFIFVTGGVCSSLGKGITAASLGRLLKSRGLNITLQKMDPYINVDPGTMSPFQHGEVFVTHDGGETDLDLGHYERFVDINLSKSSNVTTGTIYGSVINKERKGKYLGSTVQVIPHITDEIKDRINRVAVENEADIVISEIGGTIGDIEGLPFLEAIRQLKSDLGQDNVMYIHVTLVPYLEAAEELKTKPTQHSVKEMRSIGIQPDIIVCRTQKPLSNGIRDKIALFCDIDVEAVIENRNAECLYEIPLALAEEGLDSRVIERLGLEEIEPALEDWRDLVRRQSDLSKKVRVAIVGKYIQLRDAYISVVEALYHAGIDNDSEVEIEWVNSNGFNNCSDRLENVDAIIVPGGFGDRGIEGKINAINYARENKVPFLGLCLGMQCAVIEFARSVCSLEDAHSSEFYPETPDPVIDLLPEQKDIDSKGGTMRLGADPCRIKKDSLADKIYQDELIYERHRHRYEFNNAYRRKLEEKGMLFSGLSPDKRLVEIIELPSHPWFMGVQFHPEFKSRPNKPHPLYSSFIKAALENN